MYSNTGNGQNASASAPSGKDDWKTLADKIRKERREAWLQGDPFPIAVVTQHWKTAVEEACKCKTQHEAALVYAKYGIPIFPCLPEELRRVGQDGKERVYKAKSPRPQIGIGGVYLGTTDPKLINKWWGRWPNDLIGGPMGRRVGVWTTDVDAPKFHGGDGLAEWEELEAQYGTASTRVHLTGTGGNHRMYQWDPARHVGCPVKVLPEGMEVKGDGGYIILPPSPYVKDGKTLVYSVLLDEYPAIAPQWLMDMVLSQSGRRSFGTSRKKSGNGATKKEVAVIKWRWNPNFGAEKLEELCARVATAKEHHWDEAARAVFMFGRWCGGGAYNLEEACKRLREAAEKCEAPDNYPDNIERALRNGSTDPAGPFMESKGHRVEDLVAYLPQHKYIYRPTVVLWPGASVDSSMPCIDGSKAKLSQWLDQNQCVEQMTWHPGEEEFIRDKVVVEGGWKSNRMLAAIICTSRQRLS
jgi:putative DNA primase/helicase